VKRGCARGCGKKKGIVLFAWEKNKCEFVSPVKRECENGAYWGGCSKRKAKQFSQAVHVEKGRETSVEFPFRQGGEKRREVFVSDGKKGWVNQIGAERR